MESSSLVVQVLLPPRVAKRRADSDPCQFARQVALKFLTCINLDTSLIKILGLGIENMVKRLLSASPQSGRSIPVCSCPTVAMYLLFKAFHAVNLRTVTQGVKEWSPVWKKTNQCPVYAEAWVHTADWLVLKSANIRCCQNAVALRLSRSRFKKSHKSKLRRSKHTRRRPALCRSRSLL